MSEHFKPLPNTSQASGATNHAREPYPYEIWVDTDLVGDDEPHDGWQRYIKAPQVR